MASESEAISVRATRLNQIIIGNDAGKKLGRGRDVNGGVSIASSLNRESLLDALSVLYNECHKESQKKEDKHVSEFVYKCKFVDLLRS